MILILSKNYGHTYKISHKIIDNQNLNITFAPAFMTT